MMSGQINPFFKNCQIISVHQHHVISNLFFKTDEAKRQKKEWIFFLHHVLYIFSACYLFRFVPAYVNALPIIFM